MIEAGKAVRAQCDVCGHPRKEHREGVTCTVPRCACSGYMLMDLSPNRSDTTRQRSS